MKLKYALLFAVAFLFVTGVSQADPIWHVTGFTTFVGNPVCNGHPCTETIHFNFDVTYQPALEIEGQQPYQPTLLPGWKLTSVGPLAPFTMFDATFVSNDFSFGMFNAKGDEIDFGANIFVPFPQLQWVALYGCGVPLSDGSGQDPVCVKDFVPPGGVSFGWVLGASKLKYTAIDPPRAVSTPEPSVLLLLTPALWFLKRIVTR